MTSIKEKQEEAIFLENMDQNLPTLEQVLAEMELTEDTKCGFAFFQPNCLQKFASIKSFVLLFGLVGSVFSMTSSYFNGILTTLERRFQIPSRNIGIIMVGSDVATLFACWMISYYGGRKHRPRWLGLGLISIMLYCLLTSLPHFLYGPGLDALQLTEEYSQSGNVTNIGKYKPKQVLCAAEDSTCVEKDGHLIPQVIFFLAQVVSGFGDSIYWMLGSTYMDDNAAKSEAPFLLSLSFFTRMLGPVLGYNLASRCLRLFVAPFLTPLISSSDPRWIGAWWLGWIIIALVLIIPSICISCFPRELPRRAAKRLLEAKKSGNTNVIPSDDKTETSFHDMKKTLIRLCKNKVFMYTNIASILFIIGFLPFWYFATKYIEIQFRVSPSVASMVNGSMGIVAAAAGVLISGAVISKFKPETKYLAAWNMTVGLLLALGFTIYINISCPENEAAIASSVKYMNDNVECSNSCHCDYVSYNPVCGEDSITYISPCHAGCNSVSKENGHNVYKDCSCIKTVSNSTGYANDGPCPIDCQQSFILFVVVCMFLNFIGSSSRASNFLVSVRCVDEKDKSASLGFHNTLLCLFAFIPIPIFAGWMFDKFCLVWGKTCEGKGNCWLYDSANLRFYICVFTIIFILLGTVCDFLVMINAKDIKCFDEKEEADCKT